MLRRSFLYGFGVIFCSTSSSFFITATSVEWERYRRDLLSDDGCVVPLRTGCVVALNRYSILSRARARHSTREGDTLLSHSHHCQGTANFCSSKRCHKNFFEESKESMGNDEKRGEGLKSSKDTLTLVGIDPLIQGMYQPQ